MPQEPKAERSRYTPPSPTKAPPSSRLYVGLVLGCFAIGVVIIIGNYLRGGDASNLILLAGLGLILAGFLLAMRLR